MTIPTGRVAVLPNVQVDGTLTVNGDVFIPSGATFGDLESQIASKVSTSAIETAMAPYNKGFKNYIINGNFDVWQYKDTGLTHPQTSSGYGSDDRWSNANLGSTKTHSQVATTDTERALFNASYFSRTVVTSVAGANNFVTKYQGIEDVTKLAGKTVTLSFWAKADSAKNIGFVARQNFGTGGSPSAGVGSIGSKLFNLTSTWQKFTHTFTIPSIVGKTIGTNGIHTTTTSINFGFDIGSTYSTEYDGAIQQSGTFDIARVQLEEGSVATPFESRPYGLELSLCQRYFTRGAVQMHTYSSAGNTFGYQHSFPVNMRSTPTITFVSPSYVNANNLIANTPHYLGFFPTATAINSAQCAFASSFYASAEI